MALRSVPFLLLLAACSCAKEEPAQSPAPGPAASVPEKTQVPAKQATGPTGIIKGSIGFTGEPPEMYPLKRGSDSFCVKTDMKQESVVVNSNGTLRNVVVRIKPGTISGPLPKAPVVVHQSACMYRPRVQGGMVGQGLEFRNEDETFHNIHARVRGLKERQGIDTVFNRGQPAKGPVVKQKLPKVEVLEIKCDAHGWMKGFVVVSDHPYFSVTGDEGSFEIADVPVGEHQVEIWHEIYGTKQAKLVVESGKVATLALSFDAGDESI